MQENKLKHLEFIQNTIARMAGNLFYLRGWVVTLIAALLALFTQIPVGKFPVGFLGMVLLIFWIYDGYFLALERMYRDLYDKVRAMKPEEIDFSMDISEFKKLKKNSVLFCMFSKTLFFFYSPLLASAIYLLIKA